MRIMDDPIYVTCGRPGPSDRMVQDVQELRETP